MGIAEADTDGPVLHGHQVDQSVVKLCGRGIELRPQIGDLVPKQSCRIFRLCDDPVRPDPREAPVRKHVQPQMGEDITVADLSEWDTKLSSCT